MSATSLTSLPAGTWNVDPSHSVVEFSVKHMGIATVKGQFNEFEGSLVVGDDGDVSASGTVQVASIDTREAQRDDHLRSADFFDAENHPQLTFASKRVTATGDGEFAIVGDLTMRGVTREVELKATVEGTDEDPWGNQRLALSVTGEVNRSDYGMKFNQALGSGNMLVSDKVKIAIDISAVKA